MMRLGKHLAAVAAAVGVAVLALPVWATPVSLTYTGGTAGGSATITAAPAGVPAQGLPWTVGAYGFNMTDSTGNLGSFVAWCLDISDYLGTSGAQPYETTTTPFSNSYGLSAAEQGRVQAVFDANFAAVTLSNATQAAGFQVALWNAIYDADWTAAGGLFAVAGGAVATQANAYLGTAATFAGPRAYNLTFLESTGTPTRQNLVTAAPVPLPAAGLLLLGALGGVAALRRRRRAA